MQSESCDSCVGGGTDAGAVPPRHQTMPPKKRRAEAQRDNESDAESQNEEVQGEEEAAAVQPGEELGAPAEEGGGMEDAILSRQHEDNETFTYDVTEDEQCNVRQIVFVRDGTEVVYNRPDKDTDDWMLWRQMEKGRLALKKVKLLTEDLAQVARIAKKYQPERAPVQEAGLRAVPAPVQWRIKPLPSRIANSIEGRYFLTMDETVADVAGRKYVPRDEETGSMCATAGFPHAIAYQKEKGRGKRPAKLQYVVAGCNTVQITVRLKKWVASETPGEHVAMPVSETELLGLIKSAHKPSEMEMWGTYENNMVMYLGLEFDDGNAGEFSPVPAAAFTQTPAFNAIFSPPESPPYLAGQTEWEMHTGLAILKTKPARFVTSTNLKPDYKKRQFRYVVKALNPFLCTLGGFTVRSRGFCLKGVLHNDAKAGDRFVEGADGHGVVRSPAADVPK